MAFNGNDSGGDIEDGNDEEFSSEDLNLEVDQHLQGETIENSSIEELDLFRLFMRDETNQVEHHSMEGGRNESTSTDELDSFLPSLVRGENELDPLRLSMRDETNQVEHHSMEGGRNESTSTDELDSFSPARDALPSRDLGTLQPILNREASILNRYDSGLTDCESLGPLPLRTDLYELCELDERIAAYENVQDPEESSFPQVASNIERNDSNPRSRCLAFTQKVEAIKNFIGRNFPNIPQDHLESLAKYMANNLTDDDTSGMSVGERIWRYFRNQQVLPNTDTFRRLYEDLERHSNDRQPVQPNTQMEQKPSKSMEPKTKGGTKKRKKRYDCSKCGQPKVTISMKNGREIPHICSFIPPIVQKEHKGTCMGRDGNDIDQILENPGEYEVIFPNQKKDDDDGNDNDTVGSNDEDKKPPAVVNWSRDRHRICANDDDEDDDRKVPAVTATLESEIDEQQQDKENNNTIREEDFVKNEDSGSKGDKDLDDADGPFQGIKKYEI